MLDNCSLKDCYKNILIALDGSHSAHWAAVQASQLGILKDANVDLVAVLNEQAHSLFGFHLLSPDDRILVMKEIREQFLEPVRLSLEESGANIQDIRVIEGSPSEAILKISSERDSDLIIMGRHNYGLFARTIFGSVSREVMSHSSQPILVVPMKDNQSEETGNTLLVPTDFSEESKRALQHACRIAVKTKARIHLFHSLPDLDLTSLSSDPAFRKVLFPLMKAQEERLEQSHAKLEAYSKHLKEHGIESRWTLSNRPMIDSVVELCQREKVSLIVMASHGRVGIDRIWNGNAADTLINSHDCPVLVVPAEEGGE
ncbi:MAG: universal stress protein [Planctomycetota bacterium]|nr:universal stress protein [Planctomycetota bacterium]